jgi:LytS/YehU family sensor histidine kinase
LCEFLRASLNADPMEDVPLEQEIDAIDAYLSIEATRFGERLDVDIAVAPDTVNAQVPNFILQPFVENAIKHGVSLIKGPATLRVAAAREGEELVLTVTNSADPNLKAAADALPGRHRTGIGLSNTRQRLHNRYGKDALLVAGPIESGYRATIRLPFVPSRAG